MTIAIIDGDIVTFRAAASAENDTEAWVATSRANTIIEDILTETGCDGYEVWLTGANNFRYQVYPEYKANRIGMPRPKWEQSVKEFLKERWQASVSDGCEADDMMGVMRYVHTEDTVICTIDKDLNMIPGNHYNFVNKNQYVTTDQESIRFFYYQMLVGDPADNLKGVPGIGPKKAERLLLQGSSEEEWFQIVRDMYNNDEYMEITGKCLWIWRSLGDIWRMPLETTVSESERETTATNVT